MRVKIIAMLMINLLMLFSTTAFAEDLSETAVNSDKPIDTLTEEVQPEEMTELQKTSDDNELKSEQTVEPLSFTIKLFYTHEGYSIKGTLGDISDDMVSIVPCYSLDGESYTAIKDCEWQIEPNDPDMQTQQCFWQGDKPLQDYVDKKTDTIYVKLEITYTDDTVVFTEADSIVRDTAVKPLPDDYSEIYARYDAAILMRKGRPSHFWGQYHFTVADTTTDEELMALLPKQIPVELQVSQAAQNVYTENLEYTAEWNIDDITLKGEITEINTSKITAPKEATIYIGTNIYKIEDMSRINFNDEMLRVDFHKVASGTQSELILSAYGDLTSDVLQATMPLKPTGATSIIPEYSLDGGKSWISTQDIFPNAPLETAMPKIASYTVNVLDADLAPLKDYLDKKISGFMLRLKIDGGVFNGVTKEAQWPTDYEYIPPIDDTDIEGSGGNNGNVGSGNGGGTVDGQRPNLPDDNVVPSSNLTSHSQASLNEQIPANETDIYLQSEIITDVDIPIMQEKAEENDT
ncbi:MAG: hypothetical protein RRZ73_04800, partial [Oscillospiraceae bacterium]